LNVQPTSNTFAYTDTQLTRIHVLLCYTHTHTHKHTHTHTHVRPHTYTHTLLSHRGQATNGELGYGRDGKKSSANAMKCEALEGAYTHQVRRCKLRHTQRER